MDRTHFTNQFHSLIVTVKKGANRRYHLFRALLKPGDPRSLQIEVVFETVASTAQPRQSFRMNSVNALVQSLW
ncbi:hypothetical protein SBA6_290006 [Candidatus Sulfopaludibacter sp. SbA6]|nr:hypothetical protein SBA6_290006 [Candidatus Sulfopaludibacter sp. SbA6]